MTFILDKFKDIFTVRTIDSENVCLCSGKHVPDPRFLVSVDTQGGDVLLCPTAASNLAGLLMEYALTGGKPDGSITKHYGKYIRDLAEIIYNGGSMN